MLPGQSPLAHPSDTLNVLHHHYLSAAGPDLGQRQQPFLVYLHASFARLLS